MPLFTRECPPGYTSAFACVLYENATEQVLELSEHQYHCCQKQQEKYLLSLLYGITSEVLTFSGEIFLLLCLQLLK